MASKIHSNHFVQKGFFSLYIWNVIPSVLNMVHAGSRHPYGNLEISCASTMGCLHCNKFVVAMVKGGLQLITEQCACQMGAWIYIPLYQVMWEEVDWCDVDPKLLNWCLKFASTLQVFWNLILWLLNPYGSPVTPGHLVVFGLRTLTKVECSITVQISDLQVSCGVVESVKLVRDRWWNHDFLNSFELVMGFLM